MFSTQLIISSLKVVLPMYSSISVVDNVVLLSVETLYLRAGYVHTMRSHLKSQQLCCVCAPHPHSVVLVRVMVWMPFPNN